jgi:glycosyltransferase domain-containing protein
MAKLFIPTRNRPASLLNVLEYLIKFYPQTEVIIADGSDHHHKQRNKKKLENVSPKISIDYRQYPVELGLIERCLDVLESLDNEYIVWCGDDDYPVMETLTKCEKFLSNNIDYVVGIGASIKIHINENEEIKIRNSTVRNVASNSITTRMQNYSRWAFPTTYSVTRASHASERIKRAMDYGMPKFADFIMGLYDVYKGKIFAIPEIGFFETYLSTHTHSKTPDRLDFLRESDKVLAIYNLILSDLQTSNEISTDDICIKAAQKIVLNRISELSGWGFKNSLRFINSKYYNDSIVKLQHRVFDDLFKNGTETHQKFAEHLEYIFKAIRHSQYSDDNKGEPSYQNRESWYSGIS